MMSETAVEADCDDLGWSLIRVKDWKMGKENLLSGKELCCGKCDEVAQRPFRIGPSVKVKLRLRLHLSPESIFCFHCL